MKQETPVMLDTIPEILPCPFPHEKSNVDVIPEEVYDRSYTVERYSAMKYFVVCWICAARGPSAYTEHGAIELWNSAIRPGE